MFKEIKARLFPTLPREQKLEGVTTNGQKIKIKLGNNLSIDKNGLEYTINAEGGGGEITPETLLENMEGSDYISVDLNEDESKVIIELDQTKVDTEVTEDSENLVTSGAVFEGLSDKIDIPDNGWYTSNKYVFPIIERNTGAVKYAYFHRQNVFFQQDPNDEKDIMARIFLKAFMLKDNFTLNTFPGYVDGEAPPQMFTFSHAGSTVVFYGMGIHMVDDEPTLYYIKTADGTSTQDVYSAVYGWYATVSKKWGYIRPLSEPSAVQEWLISQSVHYVA